MAYALSKRRLAFRGLTAVIITFFFRVFRNSCGRTSHENRRVEIGAAENAEPGVAADGVPQQDDAEESMATSAAARFTVRDS